jgi:hypothetical protein
VGVCDPASGVCSNPPSADGTACNDHNACTQTDTCVLGVCTGSNPVTCGAQDQCHQPGTCNPLTGACTNPTQPDGTSCNDADACTTSDTCQLGRCAGTPVTCTALDQCHAVGVCDHGTGVCSNPPVNDGTACDDGNRCTQTDTCQTGVCTGANPITCAAPDPCHLAGTCNPTTGACFNPAAPNGTACSDGNACTTPDACQSGRCVGGPPVVCVAQGQCLLPGACDPVSGSCSTVTKPNGTACDDGDTCSANDTCQAGTCAAGSSACVSLALKQVTPVTKRLTVQLLGSLTENPMVVVPGDAVLFTSQVTNNGTQVEIANGEIDVTNTVVPNPNIPNDGQFSVAGYQLTLEAQDLNGNWNAVARFQRDNSGKIVTPTAPIFPISVFNPSLVLPAPGVTPPPSPPVDPMFRAIIAAGATGKWSYNFTAILPPAGVSALFDPTVSKGVRCTFKFDTSVSAKPFDGTSPPADLSQLLAGFTGVLMDPTTTITFAGMTGGGTLASPGATIPPGAVGTLAGSIPAPPFPARGTSETEAAYISRLNGAAYQVRARASGKVNTTDPPTVDFGLGLGAQLPIISATKIGPGTAIAGQTAQYGVSLRNTGAAVAGPFTIVDTVGGAQVPATVTPPASVAPATTGQAFIVAAVPAGVASVTDIAVVSWQDRNGNVYGTISSNAVTTIVQSAVLTSALVPATSVSAAEAQGATDLLRAAAFGDGRLATMPGAGGWLVPGAGALPAGRVTSAGATADARVGRVFVSATDVTVWAGGLPVTIARRYDSGAQGAAGDFGHGWSLALAPRLEVDPTQNVSVAMADGQRVPFSLGLSQYSSVVRSLLQPVFAPAAGGAGTLTSDGCSLVTVDDGHLLCFMGGGGEFAPTAYTYTEPGGRVLQLGATGDPRSITERDGSSLVFDRSGVSRPGAEPLIRFERDAEGRIAQVVVRDAAGATRVYQYGYDEAGDLRTVGSPLGALLNEYRYDAAHRLTSLRDSEGTTRAITPEGGAFTQGPVSQAAAPPALESIGLSCEASPLVSSTSNLCR